MSKSRYQNKKQTQKIRKYEDYNRPRAGGLLQGTATNRLSEYNTKVIRENSAINPQTNKQEITHPSGTHSLSIDGNPIEMFPPSVSKLLDHISEEFEPLNTYRGDVTNTLVEFSVKDYARKKGKDVDADPSKDKQKEKARIKSTMQKFRKGLTSDLDVLYRSSLGWKERQKGKTTDDFHDVRIIQEKGIVNGVVSVRLSQPFAEYLNNAYITEGYNPKLYRLSERNENLYPVARKIEIEYSEHIAKGKRNEPFIRNVGKLLKITNYPTYEEVLKSSSRSWNERIREPFEKLLDDLMDEEIIKRWEYCHEKGKPLADNKVELANYHDFANAFVKFELDK